MKLFFTIFAIFLLLGWILSDDPSSSRSYSANSAQEPAPIPEPEPIGTYSDRGIDNSWPEMDGGEAPIAKNLLAKNYYIVLDGSGSMGDSSCSRRGSRLDTSKVAVSQFIQNVGEDAGLGLFVFGAGTLDERVSIGQNQHRNVIKAVNEVRAGGGTPLRTAVAVGIMALTDQARKQLGYGEYHLVVVTDGEANDGEDPTDVVRHLVGKTPITLHTIGFCINGNHSLNQPEVAIYRGADDSESLARGLNDVLAEAPDFDASEFQSIGG